MRMNKSAVSDKINSMVEGCIDVDGELSCRVYSRRGLKYKTFSFIVLIKVLVNFEYYFAHRFHLRHPYLHDVLHFGCIAWFFAFLPTQRFCMYSVIFL